jgi:hypothetical protein
MWSKSRLTDSRAAGSDVNVTEGTPDKDGNQGVEWARRLVNCIVTRGSVDDVVPQKIFGITICEHLRGVSGLSQSSECTRSGVNAGHADGKDGDTDGDVDEVFGCSD